MSGAESDIEATTLERVPEHEVPRVGDECPDCGDHCTHWEATGARACPSADCRAAWSPPPARGTKWRHRPGQTEETDQLWDVGTRELQDQLDEYYGVEGIWIQGDYYHEGRDELLYDVLTYFDGDDEHLIADDVPVFGHVESGAVGVDREDLPSKETVQSVVDAAENGGA
jgi:hypothetical protein